MIDFWNKARDWAAAHPKSILALAVVVALGPFLAKPFNMDDPLFIWTARQIHARPWDPYGFNLIWYRTLTPMWVIMKNPPLAGYYAALAAGVLGWSETALHLAFLLPALAAILGSYKLARHFCDQPLAAALAVLFTPGFLVSGTSVMCDVLMLAFWVWAAALWIEGMEQNDFRRLAGAGVLIALAALTKYYGMCLIPLLGLYGWMRRRRLGWWVAGLLIPLLTLAAYDWATRSLYQHNLMSEAAIYASRMNPYFGGLFAGQRAAAGLTAVTVGDRAAASFNALTFTGGCLALAVFLAPWLWRARVVGSFVGAAALAAMALFLEGPLLAHYSRMKDGLRWSMEAQIIFWAAGGLAVLALAAADFWRRRDASSCLLSLWVLGTFVFTALFNWTVNGRSVLPMAPAVGILLARRWQELAGAKQIRPAMVRRGILAPWVAGALLAALVTWSDYVLAVAARQSAREVRRRCAQSGQTLWFQGHWGFQYYLEQLGGQALDRLNPAIRDGEILAVPLNNSNLQPPDSPRNAFYVKGPRWLTDMNQFVGAGFYSSSFGPLPFVFGHVPPENILLYTWKSGPGAKP